MKRNAACLLSLSTFVLGAAAQPPNWLLQNPASHPTGREGHAMAFDAARQEVVLFGGYDGVAATADTWVWTGSSWLPRQPSTSPPARFGHAMAYDSGRQRIVLWGGSSLDAAVWEWDGADWSAVNAPGPVARYWHAMAYDAARGRVVMFGGSVFGFADTWEWDGTNWIPRVSLHYPPGRSTHAMAYDAARQRTVLFGGQSRGVVNQDTWEWDGTDWTQMASGGPPARARQTMVWWPTTQRVLLFGGMQPGLGAFAFADTWTWDGTTWTQLVTTTAPSPRVGMAASFHQGYGLVLFGGRDMPSSGPTTWFDQTFLFGGAVALAAIFGQACGTPPLLLQPAANSRPLLGTVARAVITNAPSSATLIAAGSSGGVLGPFALPLPLSGFGMTGCWLSQSAETLGLPVAPVAGGYEFAAAVPSSVSLLNALVYLQAYALAPGQNPAGIIASNALVWRCGDL